MECPNDSEPFAFLVKPLARHLFEQNHLIWTPEEVEAYWRNADNQLIVQQYEYLARIALNYLLPILAGQ